jgi:hypothetical protein
VPPVDDTFKIVVFPDAKGAEIKMNDQENGNDKSDNNVDDIGE